MINSRLSHPCKTSPLYQRPSTKNLSRQLITDGCYSMEPSDSVVSSFEWMTLRFLLSRLQLGGGRHCGRFFFLRNGHVTKRLTIEKEKQTDGESVSPNRNVFLYDSGFYSSLIYFSMAISAVSAHTNGFFFSTLDSSTARPLTRDLKKKNWVCIGFWLSVMGIFHLCLTKVITPGTAYLKLATYKQLNSNKSLAFQLSA